MSDPRPGPVYLLDYVRLGYRVFPCNLDKTPLIKDWGGRARDDQTVVATWWRRWPQPSRAVRGRPGKVRSGYTGFACRHSLPAL